MVSLASLMGLMSLVIGGCAAMSSIDRRQREKHETQDKILAAARDLFLNHGFDAVSMRKIADAIEYTPATLYGHFKDKVELMRELCRRDFAAMDREMLAIVGVGGSGVADPVRRIHECGRIYIRFGTEHKNQYRLMFMTPHPREVVPTEDDLAEMNDPDRSGYAFLCKSVAEAIAAGRLRREFGDVHSTVQTLWAACHGVVALETTHGDDPCVPIRPLMVRSELTLLMTLRGMLRGDDAYHAVLDKAAREVSKVLVHLPPVPVQTVERAGGAGGAQARERAAEAGPSVRRAKTVKRGIVGKRGSK